MIGRYSYKYGTPTLNTAMKALSIARTTAALLNVEVKKTEYTGTAVAINASTGNVIPISTMGAGTSIGQREGNSIKLKYISGNLKFNKNASATNSPCVRIVIVIDKQCVADTVPAWSDVFSTASPLSHLNRNTVGRFTIIYDRKFTLNQTDTISKLHSFNIKSQMHVRFNGTASTDYQKNPVFMLVFSDEPTNPATFDYDVRLGYVDN